MRKQLCAVLAGLILLSLPVSSKAAQSMDEADFILPAMLTEICESAFEGGAAEVVKLSEKTRTIGKRAFADCTRLRQIYIPASVTDIAPDAFEGCGSGLIIFGEKKTAAETFAEDKGLTFVNTKAGISLDDDGDIVLPSVPLP